MNFLSNYLLLLFCLITLNLSAQNSENRDPIFTVYAAPGQPIPDSIHVAFLRGIINGNAGNRKNIYLNNKNEYGNFTFSLPDKQPISPFLLLVWYGKDVQYSSTYYAEINDQIKIAVTKGNVLKSIGERVAPQLSFSGTGSIKYQVVNILSKLNMDIYRRELSNTNKFKKEFLSEGYQEKKTDLNFKLERYLETLFNNLTSDIAKNKDILSKNESRLGKKVTSFFSYELNPYVYLNWSIMELFRDIKFKNYMQEISEFYFSKIDKIRPIPKDTWFKYGVGYRKEKSDEFLYETLYRTKGKGTPLSTQYDELKNVRNIELRDILLTKFFTESYLRSWVSDNETYDSCLTDAIKIVKDDSLRDALNRQILFKKGSKVFPFSFFDSAGKIITLSDLKGKVFILDFYYYGCVPCSIYAKKIEQELYPEFAENDDFKIVSVNTDKKKEIWMKAIKSGKYTFSETLNLSTGVGFDHPSFRYYNIQSLPFVLLVGKDGKLISRLEHQSSSEIRNIIREALREPSSVSGK